MDFAVVKESLSCKKGRGATIESMITIKYNYQYNSMEKAGHKDEMFWGLNLCRKTRIKNMQIAYITGNISH